MSSIEAALPQHSPTRDIETLLGEPSAEVIAVDLTAHPPWRLLHSARVRPPRHPLTPHTSSALCAAQSPGHFVVVSGRHLRTTRAAVLGIDRALLRSNTGRTTHAMADRYSKPRGHHLVEMQRQVVGYLDRAEGRIDSMNPKE